MRRTTRCALAGGLLTLLLGLLFLPLAKGSIEKGLTTAAGAKLTSAGLAGIGASSNWADLTLTGPAAQKASALAAVKDMDHASSVHQVTYVATDGTGTAPAPSTSPSPATGSVGVQAAFDASASPSKVTLTGVVASEAEHQAIHDSAVSAVGAASVVDQLTVSPGDVSSGVASAADRFATLLGPLAAAQAQGTMSLNNTALTINATAPSAQNATNANSALDVAKSAGLSVTGQVTIAQPSAGIDTGLKGVDLKGITFDTGSATLTSQGQATLDKAVVALKAKPTVKIDIAGYTDNVGSPDTNLTLSTARAKAVRNYLISQGIDGARLTAHGYGQADPIADNNTAAGRQANRRIDLKIVGS